MIRIRNFALGPDLYKDIFDWDVRTWSRALEVWEKEVDGNKNCLEIGANKGGLSLWLALHGHTVLCTDLDNPSERAESIHSKHQVSHLISYSIFDVLDPRPNPISRSTSSSRESNLYDLIIFKSILGGISRDNNLSLAKEAITNMHALLKPGGTLLFAENLCGSALHSLARKIFVKWGGSWNYLTVSELENLFSDFERVEVKATGFATAFAKGNKLNGLMSFLDHWIFNQVMGKGMKYVGYGRAKKTNR